jgi:single-strand DNA-binding protein
MYLNKVFIIGNLTRDPELKSLPSGMQVATFGMATNRVFRDRDGNKQEAAEFHNIVVFGKTGELAAQYLRKGSQALIEGRLQTRSWEADGQKKYRTEIVADRVQFGDRRPDADAGAPARGPQTTAAKKNDVIEYPTEEINPDDIPF